MLGFEVGQISLEEALQRLVSLRELAVFPVDERGQIISDDSVAHDSAREIRLVMQKVFELDPLTFFREMRYFFFHLFAGDHSHYSDLLNHAVQREPELARIFCIDLITSRDVLFIDDQKTLHHLITALEKIGLQSLSSFERDQLAKIFEQPLLRLPSIHAHLLQFLAPMLSVELLPTIRRLFEMGWTPREKLTWDDFLNLMGRARIPENLLPTPIAHSQNFEQQVQLSDFENLRWMAGLESSATALRFRMLGCLVAGGPQAEAFFFEASEEQPETAFHRDNFETLGQLHMFRRALGKLREDIIREAHHSEKWFRNPEPEREWSWQKPGSEAWPIALRWLPIHWGEFANITDTSDFGGNNDSAIKTLDQLAETIATMAIQNPLPTTDLISEANELAEIFLQTWTQILPDILVRLDVVP